MRCGTRIVSNGDGKDKVRALCGEPTSISFVGIQSAPRYYYGPYDYSYFGPGVIEVPVELEREGARVLEEAGPTLWGGDTMLLSG